MGTFNDIFYCKFPAECNSERLLKIGQYRSIFGEVIDKSLVSCFFESRCKGRRNRKAILRVCVCSFIHYSHSSLVKAMDSHGLTHATLSPMVNDCAWKGIKTDPEHQKSKALEGEGGRHQKASSYCSLHFSSL